MDYEQFLKQVAEDLKYSIPNATIEISDVVKVQGESYRGISVRMNDSPIAASMNLRGAHERLMDGADYHDILQSIHDQAIEAVSQGRGFDLDLVQDYGKAKQIANRHYKVSVGMLGVRYAKIIDDDTVEYDVAKKDANAIAIVKEDK